MKIVDIKLTKTELDCIKMELENCESSQQPPFPFASKDYQFFVENVKMPFERALEDIRDYTISIPENIVICINKLKECALDNWESMLDENFVNEDSIEGGDIDTSDFEGKDDSCF